MLEGKAGRLLFKILLHEIPILCLLRAIAVCSSGMSFHKQHPKGNSQVARCRYRHLDCFYRRLRTQSLCVSLVPIVGVKQEPSKNRLRPHGQITVFPAESWLRHYKPVLLLFPLLFRAKMAAIESSRLLA